MFSKLPMRQITLIYTFEVRKPFSKLPMRQITTIAHNAELETVF